MADKRLGKGLDALIPSYATESSHIDGAVPIAQIIPNRNQPRQEFDPGKLEELTASIKENGIIVAPIIVNSSQVLKKYIKKNNKIQEEDITDVVFVPNLKGTKD